MGPIKRFTVNPGAQEVDAPAPENWRPLIRGPRGYCPIVMLCDAPTPLAAQQGMPLQKTHHAFLVSLAKKHGFVLGDIKLMGLCPPIPKQDLNSASRKWKHVEKYMDTVHTSMQELQPRIMVTFGELATRAMHGRPIKITRVRGVPIIPDDGPPLLPMLSPGFVNRIPEHVPTFNADMATLTRIKATGYDVTQFTRQEGEYEWCLNIGRIRNDMAAQMALTGAEVPVISVDTEGTGLRWWDPDVFPFTVQISVRPGHAYVIPINEIWWDAHDGNYDLRQVREDLKLLLEDPNVRKVGHNIKFEIMHLRSVGMEVNGWLHDTQLMLFGVDENLMDKSLSTGVKIYVPEMGGYSDFFDQEHDKSMMWDVPKEDVTNEDGTITPGLKTYAGGDADATLRLAQRLRPLLSKDLRQLNCYRRIQMPAIQCFANTLEPHGLLVNQTKLTEFGETLDVYLEEAYRSLIARVPAAVKQDHLDRGKELKFSRADFIRDILFTRAGFGLKPKVYTDSTKDLPADQRQASTSGKKHLPYFTTVPTLIGRNKGTVGDFVSDLTAYQKAQKLNTTYVGKQDEGNGLWQYLAPWGRIHPSYMLHRTNTGRTASADPNGQNFPTRGDWAKPYKECFEASPGFVIVSCDLSQIELRLVAWTSRDPTMMGIYKSGGDIHSTTAANVMGVPADQFASWKNDDRLLLDCANEITGSGEFLQKMNAGRRGEAKVSDFFKQRRFNAKAVNFGIVYGMSARGFQVYAKTEYGIDYTYDQCVEIRANFFQTYSALPLWHQTMHRFAREHGYVRSLHGAVRHVPSVYSDDEAIRAAALRYAVNSPIQRFGSDLGLMGLIRFCHQADSRVIRVTGFIHDALYMEVRRDLAEEAAAALKWCMENPPLQEWFGIESPLPIVSDPEVNGEERPDIAALKPDWWNEDEEEAARQYTRTSVVYT